MRIIFFIFSINLLFANITVYKGKDVNFSFPSAVNVKEFNSSLKEYVALLSYKELPFVFDKNLVIISSFSPLETFIYSHKKIENIRLIGTDDFIGKIFFNAMEKRVEYKPLDINNFLAKNLDAIVTHKRENFLNVYEYDLSELGFKFDRYYLVATQEYTKTHKKEIEFLSSVFPHSFSSALFLSSYYFGKKIHFHPLYLDHISNYLSKRYKVVTTISWPPFNFIENGEVKGIGIDFWKLIAKEAGIDYEIIPQKAWVRILELIKEKRADIVPATAKTEKREEFAIFSNPYISFPFAIACRVGEEIKSIEDIKSIAVGYNYSAHHILKSHYKNLNFIVAPDIKDAFDLVANYKAECVADVLPTVIWMINKEYLGRIKVFFTTPFEFELRVMLREELEDVKRKIDFAISKISPTQKQEIVSKYIGEKVIIQKNDFKVYIIISILMLIILILIYKFVIHKNRSKLDPLTKILNRGSVESVFKEVIKKRDGSIILFDLDYFKNVNDKYGHNKGDFLLKSISKIIKHNLRESDYFGRWGGEEFIIILPNTPYDKAEIVAEKIRKLIEDYDFDGIKVTLSLGVVSFKKGEDVKDVIKRADKLLYEAKNEGRNQVKGEK